MEFMEATDRLLGKNLQLMMRLAERMHMSESVLRQSRISPDKATRRAPPKGWKPALLWVAETVLLPYVQQLVADLRKDILSDQNKPAYLRDDTDIRGI